MRKLIGLAMLAALVMVGAVVAEDLTQLVHGLVTKIDKDAKIVYVKSKDGTEHAIHWSDKTAVAGVDKTAEGAKDSWHGIKVGSEVVAHVTKKDSVETADEVDKVGKDGVKWVEGTVTKVDKDGKKVYVKAADGTEHVFDVTSKDATAAGDATAKAAKKTWYYTEDGAKKVLHFFQ